MFRYSQLLRFLAFLQIKRLRTVQGPTVGQGKCGGITFYESQTDRHPRCASRCAQAKSLYAQTPVQSDTYGVQYGDTET